VIVSRSILLSSKDSKPGNAKVSDGFVVCDITDGEKWSFIMETSAGAKGKRLRFE